MSHKDNAATAVVLACWRQIEQQKDRISELKSVNADILAAVDQFMRDEGYSDDEVGEFLCPWISKIKAMATLEKDDG
jgi:hypothetical protein